MILKMLAEKSLLKQEVFHKTRQIFSDLKSTLKEIHSDLKASVKIYEKKLSLEYFEKGDYEVEFRIAGDSIIFMMHTNVFTFDREHNIWKTSYVQEDNARSYCGVIYIYNFLADSLRFSRANDVGYLIGRIFVNKDLHFFVEGKRQMGFLYNDFAHAVLDKDNVRSVIESAILYCLDFDLYSPAYENVKEISVQQILESTLQQRIVTGKRLGFRFQADDDTA
ncbi:MAG TPA: hypothetical protein VI757_06415 [Bacteroidia bacterium]|nr:hypothetical protein [Bacteroidia bacterium]